MVLKKTPLIPFGQKIGFLGGGQLAQMLALKAHSMGLIPYVLCENSSEPAVQVAPFWMKGHPHTHKDLKAFANLVDVLTFESEFYSGEKLAALNLKKHEVDIFPRPQALSLLQDRLFQKELLLQYHLPTAPYLKLNSMEEVEISLDLFKNGSVLKKRMGGYDGHGTYILRHRRDIEEFRTNFKRSENLFIAEAFIPFKREMAISVVRNRLGEMVFLPLVETKQTDQRCDYVIGPMKHRRLSHLKKLIKEFVQGLDYVGIMAFELFDTGSELLVNEIAPRVHNSAHYSQNALNCDQFEYHLRAVMGWKLPPCHVLGHSFAMTNLIGHSTQNPKLNTKITGHLHWYQKKENRPGRKMGHINYLSPKSSPQNLLKLALKERKSLSL